MLCCGVLCCVVLCLCAWGVGVCVCVRVCVCVSLCVCCACVCVRLCVSDTAGNTTHLYLKKVPFQDQSPERGERPLFPLAIGWRVATAEIAYMFALGFRLGKSLKRQIDATCWSSLSNPGHEKSPLRQNVRFVSGRVFFRFGPPSFCGVFRESNGKTAVFVLGRPIPEIRRPQVAHRQKVRGAPRLRESCFFQTEASVGEPGVCVCVPFFLIRSPS